jgi:hypothetical protein
MQAACGRAVDAVVGRRIGLFPGGHTIRRLCAPAAAMVTARLAISCPRTSAKSSSFRDSYLDGHVGGALLRRNLVYAQLRNEGVTFWRANYSLGRFVMSAHSLFHHKAWLHAKKGRFRAESHSMSLCDENGQRVLSAAHRKPMPNRSRIESSSLKSPTT